MYEFGDRPRPKVSLQFRRSPFGRGRSTCVLRTKAVKAGAKHLAVKDVKSLKKGEARPEAEARRARDQARPKAEGGPQDHRP